MNVDLFSFHGDNLLLTCLVAWQVFSCGVWQRIERFTGGGLPGLRIRKLLSYLCTRGEQKLESKPLLSYLCTRGEQKLESKPLLSYLCTRGEQRLESKPLFPSKLLVT